MRLYKRLCLAILLAGLLHGQSADICGEIFDPSGRPVASATVTCGDTSTVTREDGSFHLSVSNACEATITAAGFDTQKAPLSGSNNRVALTLAGVAETVVVSATRGEVSPDQAGVAANVVTAEDLRQRQFPFVADVLREMPGAQIVKTGRYGGVTSLFTRGGPNNGTLVLLDGVPLNQPGDSANLADLMSTGIDRIEFVRGPESALFGAQASGGVLQLFTKRGDPESSTPHGSVAYERGSFQTDRWSANLEGGAGKLGDYSFSADQFHTVGEYQNDYYRNTAGVANLGLRISPATELRGIFRAFDSTVGLPNRVGYGLYDFSEHQMDRDYTAGLSLTDMRGHNFFQKVSGGYHWERSIDLNPDTDGPYSVAALVRDVAAPVHRVYLVSLLNPSALPGPGQIPAGERVVAKKTTLYGYDPFVGIVSRGDFNYQGTWAQPSGSLVFGYDFERQGGLISSLDVARRNNGFFANEQYTFLKHLSISFGALVEQSSIFGTEFTPRGAASFQVSGERGPLSSLLVRASAGRGVREPSLLESFAADPYYVGNPALRLEKTNSYEAGVVAQWFHRVLRTEVSAFRNSFRDLIVYTNSANPLVGTWANIDAAYARGFEFSAQAKLGRWARLSGQHTFLWSRVINSVTPNSLDTGIGQELPRRPHNSSALSLAIAPARWNFQMTAWYFGERQEEFDLFGANRAPGYWGTSANGSYRLTKHVTPFVRVENVANSLYQEVLGYNALSRNILGGARLEW
jgi:vitamin B12 transporter